MIFCELNMVVWWDVCKCYFFKMLWVMLERKISKIFRKDCEFMVFVVDIKLFIFSESMFSLRFLKVGEVLMIL